MQWINWESIVRVQEAFISLEQTQHHRMHAAFGKMVENKIVICISATNKIQLLERKKNYLNFSQ